jgi:hypothetical protein
VRILACGFRPCYPIGQGVAASANGFPRGRIALAFNSKEGMSITCDIYSAQLDPLQCQTSTLSFAPMI